MIYRFYCPVCGEHTELKMPASEYTSDGHLCKCGAELKRDPHDFCHNYQVDCGGFYAAHQSGTN